MLQAVAKPAYLSRFLFPGLPSVAGVAPPVVSEWCQELAIAPRVRLGKSIESSKPGEREIYNPEVARVGLGQLAPNLVRRDPGRGKQKYPRCVLDDVPVRVRLVFPSGSVFASEAK